nr:hypothetical protein [uncultured bacterium]
MKCTFLTGGYAKKEEAGVCRFSFDSDGGFLPQAGWTGFLNPSFLLPHPDLPVLYTVEETNPEGMIHAWRMTENGPEHSACFSSGGADPCHLSLSADRRFLYAANYSGGSLAAFSLDEQGNITDRSFLSKHRGHGPNILRQEAAHVHFSREIDGVLYACDLGQDSIFLYRNAGGAITETGRIRMPAGSGPRHLESSARYPGVIWCVSELSSEVFTLKNTEDGWRICQELSLLPEGFRGESTAAAIHLSPDGSLLLATNRGHDSAAVFPLLPDGTLGDPVLSPCAAVPRDFMTAGDYVIIGSQRDSLIRAYRLDRESLKLSDTGWSVSAPSPVCFAPI